MVLGNLQTDDRLTTSTRSPTPSLHTTFVQAAIAAAKGRYVFTFDVGQAFLNAQLRADGSEDVILQLSKHTAKILYYISHRCIILHTGALYCSQAYYITHRRIIFHTDVLYYTQAYHIAHGRIIFHTGVLYFTQAYYISHRCIILLTGVLYFTHL